MSPSSRERVLEAVRASLPARGEAALRRVSDHDANLVPARARGPGADLEALFAAMAEAVKCTLARVADEAEVPASVAAFLARHNLPTEIAMAPDPRLDRIPWSAAPLLRVRRGAARASDLVAVTGTAAAIAETGTLMMASGPGRPNTLNFLPDHHIVVVGADDIVATYEDAWRRLGRDADGAELPRTVALITGPSRTSDIELVPTLGAHGPRRLHIVIAGAASAAAG